MNDELRKQREERVVAAMNGRKIDRTPLMFAGDQALVRYARPDFTFREMIEKQEEMAHIVCEDVLSKFPKVDLMVQMGGNNSFMGAFYGMGMALPGEELDDNEMWQIKFEHWMGDDIYDRIINEGWTPILNKRLFEDVGYDPESMGAAGAVTARCKRLYTDTGFPFANEGLLCAPFDAFTFARGQIDFYTDLFEEGDKIKECMNIMMEEEENALRDQIAQEVADNAARGERTMYFVSPCLQANCGLLGRDQFEEFGWPLIERQTNFLLDLGCYVRFHMDTQWTDFLDYFTCFPKGKCIFDTDGGTDLEKVRDILGPTMAFTGTIEPATFAFGTPDQVYDAVKEQIEIMGDSFIVAPSCNFPANAPAANIDAMYAAVDEL